MVKTQIRELRRDEASVVARVHNTAFAPWIASLPSVCRQHEITAQAVQEWDGHVFVALGPSGIVGYAHAQLDSSGEVGFETTDEHAGQSQIAVLPQHRRGGIGRALLEFVVQRLGGHGPCWVCAGAYSDNTEATGFLSALGFQTGKLDVPCPGNVDPFHTDDDILATFDLTGPLPKVPTVQGLVVREVSESDIDDMRILVGASRPAIFGSQPSAADVRGWMEGGWAETILVAELGDRIVASMEFRPWGVLGITGVLPELRRRGIGAALLARTLAVMKEREIPHALADTGWFDRDAIRLYQRLGFDTSRCNQSWVRRAAV